MLGKHQNTPQTNSICKNLRRGPPNLPSMEGGGGETELALDINRNYEFYVYSLR